MLKNVYLKYLVILSGILSLIIGIIGIFLPILPTAPFVLLAAICFAHSSPKLYDKLINNRVLGKIIRDYREGRGMAPKAIAVSVSFLWITILSSVIFATDSLWHRILLIVIAIVVSIHIIRLRAKE